MQWQLQNITPTRRSPNSPHRTTPLSSRNCSTNSHQQTSMVTPVKGDTMVLINPIGHRSACPRTRSLRRMTWTSMERENLYLKCVSRCPNHICLPHRRIPLLVTTSWSQDTGGIPTLHRLPHPAVNSPHFQTTLASSPVELLLLLGVESAIKTTSTLEELR